MDASGFLVFVVTVFTWMQTERFISLRRSTRLITELCISLTFHQLTSSPRQRAGVSTTHCTILTLIELVVGMAVNRTLRSDANRPQLFVRVWPRPKELRGGWCGSRSQRSWAVDPEGLWAAELITADQGTHIYMVTDTHTYTDLHTSVRKSPELKWLMLLYRQQGHAVSDNHGKAADQCWLCRLRRGKSYSAGFKAAESTSSALNHHMTYFKSVVFLCLNKSWKSRLRHSLSSWDMPELHPSQPQQISHFLSVFSVMTCLWPFVMSFNKPLTMGAD